VDAFWFGQDRDRIGLEAGAGSMAGFELALEDDGGEGELLGRQAEGGAKKDFGRPASGESHEAHTFFEVALAGNSSRAVWMKASGSRGIRLDWSLWMRWW
jgi:hypothetical protein